MAALGILLKNSPFLGDLQNAKTRWKTSHARDLKTARDHVKYPIQSRALSRSDGSRQGG